MTRRRIAADGASEREAQGLAAIIHLRQAGAGDAYARRASV
jgi:hypothetical protein